MGVQQLWKCIGRYATTCRTSGEPAVHCNTRLYDRLIGRLLLDYHLWFTLGKLLDCIALQMIGREIGLTLTDWGITQSWKKAGAC